jgi:putative alpha-1,2-mannosidase
MESHVPQPDRAGDGASGRRISQVQRWLDQYLKFGYVPHDYGPVSHTLEYAFDDWAVSQMAKSLGKMDDYWYFKRRAHNYLNIWIQKPAT